MKSATPKARLLLAKLEALAERPGTQDEANAALGKIAHLRARYDFTAPAGQDAADLFRGTFRPARYARPLAVIPEPEIAANVKWAIESKTGIPCLFQGPALFAEINPGQAAQLGRIAASIAESFRALTQRYACATGAALADRRCFIMGLYDGMTGDTRPAGQPLPSRAPAGGMACRRPKKKALTTAPGLNVHPYSLALDLGKHIRFSVPLEEITNQLAQTLNPKEITV